MILYLLYGVASYDGDRLDGIYQTRDDAERVRDAQECPREYRVDEYDTEKDSMPLPSPDFKPNPWIWQYEVDRDNHRVESVDGSRRVSQGDTTEYPHIEGHRLAYRVWVTVTAYTRDEADIKASEAYKAFVNKPKES
jgi:hypothetical protein